MRKQEAGAEVMRDRSARHAGPPARRGQEPVTSASTTPGAAGEWRRRLDARRRGSMALTRKGTEARDALSAAALRRAAEEDAPKGGRCLRCRPGGRYFKYRPPLAAYRPSDATSAVEIGRVAGGLFLVRGTRQLAGGRGGSVAWEKQRLARGGGRRGGAIPAIHVRRNATPASGKEMHSADGAGRCVTAWSCSCSMPRCIKEEGTKKRDAGRIWPDHGGAPASHSHGVRHEAEEVVFNFPATPGVVVRSSPLLRARCSVTELPGSRGGAPGTPGARRRSGVTPQNFNFGMWVYFQIYLSIFWLF